jgi:predicted ribosomally synthesized peptide with nif11-like leader
MSSPKSVQDFLNQLENDAEFRRALTDAPHPAGKIGIISDAGYQFTSEELNGALIEKGVSQMTLEYARNAVQNIAPEDIEYSAVGWWMFFSNE